MFADLLSRKPIKYKQSAAEQVTINVMVSEEDQFLNASVVAMEIMRDPVLGMVLQFTQQGWRNNLEPVFQPYYSKRLELSHARWYSPVELASRCTRVTTGFLIGRRACRTPGYG